MFLSPQTGSHGHSHMVGCIASRSSHVIGAAIQWFDAVDVTESRFFATSFGFFPSISAAFAKPNVIGTSTATAEARSWSNEFGNKIYEFERFVTWPTRWAAIFKSTITSWQWQTANITEQFTRRRTLRRFTKTQRWPRSFAVATHVEITLRKQSC